MSTPGNDQPRVTKGDPSSNGGKWKATERPGGADLGLDAEPAPDLTSPRDLAEAVIEGRVANAMDHAGNWDEQEWEEYRAYGVALQADLADRHASNYLGVTTAAYTSEIDGALVIDVDTSAGPANQRVRLNVNDGAVYDEDPEVGSVAGKIADRLVAADRYEREGDDIAAHHAAMAAYREASRLLDRLNQKAIAARVTAQWPHARFALLEDSDEGRGYVIVGLADAEGTDLGVDNADIDEADDDLWSMASDLRSTHSAVEEIYVLSTGRVRETRLDLAKAAAL